jgi:hypothetical protein
MTKKPDGKSANTERVTFTRDSAVRIGKAVRKVEHGSRDMLPYDFEPRLSAAAGKTFRVCTFTGAWAIDAAKIVTFKNQTTTPNTVSATNLFLGLPENGTRNCGIAKDGTGWYLIQWQMDAATALSGATLGTASLEFSRINVASLGTATTVSIAVTTCSTAAS